MQISVAEAGEEKRKCRFSRRKRARQGGRCAQRVPTFGGLLLAFRNGSPRMERKLSSDSWCFSFYFRIVAYYSLFSCADYVFSCLFVLLSSPLSFCYLWSSFVMLSSLLLAGPFLLSACLIQIPEVKRRSTLYSAVIIVSVCHS